MQLTKESISLKLKDIEKLECAVEDRIIGGATEAKDIHGKPLSEANIQAAIETLADSIVERYPNVRPILISIMDGAMPFAQRLNDALGKRKCPNDPENKKQYSFEYTSMQASSYSGTQSTGKVNVKAPPKLRVGARTVILVDDVCDTGRTCKALKDLFMDKGAEEVILMVLVDKKQSRGATFDETQNPEDHDTTFDPEFIGFTLSKDDFIIGVGLDYEGGCRNLSTICVADTSTLPTTEEKKILDEKDHYNDLLEKAIQNEKASKYQVKTLFSSKESDVAEFNKIALVHGI